MVQIFKLESIDNGNEYLNTKMRFISDKGLITYHATAESRGRVRIDIPNEEDPDFE